MIKTSFDPVQILQSQLLGSELNTQMTGGLYKMARPTNSELEDIVINGLPITADQFQTATANVNLYVPDLQVKLVNTIQYMPNTDRLAHLASLAMDLFYEYYAPTFRFALASQQTIAEEEIKQHYINLRIDFEFFPDS